MLSENAVVLNVGRGTAIDTDALADALYAGKIAGAALDVTDPEPLPTDHQLWNAPESLLITLHARGFSFGDAGKDRRTVCRQSGTVFCRTAD